MPTATAGNRPDSAGPVQQAWLSHALVRVFAGKKPFRPSPVLSPQLPTVWKHVEPPHEPSTPIEQARMLVAWVLVPRAVTGTVQASAVSVSAIRVQPPAGRASSGWALSLLR